MTPDDLKIILRIHQGSKGVPYPPEDGEDSKNSGFRDLKGLETAASEIPEVGDSPPLLNALVAINALHTPFFTVGCEKSLNEYQGKYWKRGYLEFSYNHAELIVDAAAYFPLFFHFSKIVHNFTIKNSIQFVWELQGARFKKIGVGGFTCCVWITNGDYDTKEECERIWTEGLNLLSNFLVSVSPCEYPPIYGPGNAS